ncbi:MAG: hypothetical protein JWQ39_2162 [Glaciihabitans sp.]|nr:hypothetical protein [Glaciihabitans sp.]
MMDFPIPTSWDRPGFEGVGFKGFVPLLGLDRDLLPTRRGVYSVFRESASRPTFVDTNVITRRKAYDVGRLNQKWIDGQSVVYIGMAEPKDGLYGRLGDFSRQSSSHTGGRALWQLAGARELIVAWVETPEHVAEVVEKSYLRAFKEANGRYPFANWRL